MMYVLHYNAVAPIRCTHRTLDSARREVAEQLRDFRRLKRTAKTIRRGEKWRIGAEVVRIVCAAHCTKEWPPRNADYQAMLDLTLANG